MKPSDPVKTFLARNGRKGGRATSAIKTAAVRRNAKKPRPGRRYRKAVEYIARNYQEYDYSPHNMLVQLTSYLFKVGPERVAEDVRKKVKKDFLTRKEH